MQNLILQNAIWYVFCDIIIDNKLYVIMDIFVYLTLCFAIHLDGPSWSDAGIPAND